jgi:hypothetical protein
VAVANRNGELDARSTDSPVRPEIACGAIERAFRPLLVSGLLFGAAAVLLVWCAVMVAQIGAPGLIAGVPALYLVGVGIFFLFTFHTVRWDARGLELDNYFRHRTIAWHDVLSYRKLSVTTRGTGGHVDGETAPVIVSVRWRRGWVLVQVTGFATIDTFGLLGPPLSARKYVTPFDLYVAR